MLLWFLTTKAMGVPGIARALALKFPRRLTIEHNGLDWTESMVTIHMHQRKG